MRTSRIAPLSAPYEPAVRDQLEQMMPAGGPPILLFRTFAKNLPMTRAMRGWGSYELSRQLSLSMRDREILVDRTCARCGCEYEWGVHVAFFAARVGLDRAQTRSLTAGTADDACWESARDRMLIRAADALHDHADLEDALAEELLVELGEESLLDLLMLCGWYHAISFVANGARVAHEPGSPSFADVVGS
jgi:hypothetical protein